VADRVAVIDIGKSNAKVAIVDLVAMKEVAVRTRPNAVLRIGPYPHHDIDGLWAFILESLVALNKERAVDAISVTTHGATAAVLDAAGDLAMPVLDYEHDGPDTMRAAYEKVRPLFRETGSPALPIGLNLGAQLFWQEQAHQEMFARVAKIVMYPQYWAMRLTGVAASEVTSLGCHTDLWNPSARDFSSLVDAMGWRKHFPPLRPASDVLGSILPEIAVSIGLRAGTPVVCGIHDSNASLLPHLMTRKPPFAVVSTGTWVVSMAVGGKTLSLDPARDTLVNVNAFGDPVPSARFMGGREFETFMQGAERRWDEADIDAVLSSGVMLLPSIQQGSGPFPQTLGGWQGTEPEAGRRFVAASYYLALMTATCLDLIGAEGEIVVEGPFAANEPLLSMVAAATGRPVVASTGQSTGTSIGAALLASARRPSLAAAAATAAGSEALRRYAAIWKARVEGLRHA
jgi:sugar (pentulose or hexulose) kinase